MGVCGRNLIWSLCVCLACATNKEGFCASLFALPLLMHGESVTVQKKKIKSRKKRGIYSDLDMNWSICNATSKITLQTCDLVVRITIIITSALSSLYFSDHTLKSHSTHFALKIIKNNFIELLNWTLSFLCASLQVPGNGLEMFFEPMGCLDQSLITLLLGV